MCYVRIVTLHMAYRMFMCFYWDDQRTKAVSSTQEETIGPKPLSEKREG